jgi:hypothetical protein
MKLGESSVVIPSARWRGHARGPLQGAAGEEGHRLRAAAVRLPAGRRRGGRQRFRSEPIASINEKYVEAAKDAVQRRSARTSAKSAARKFFYDAERGYFDYARWREAVGKLQGAARRARRTAFVGAIGRQIAARAEGA